MNVIKKAIGGSVVAAALAMAVPAAAEMELYKDYEPSKEVVEMTFVKVDEGQFETYLEGLKSTWVAANEAQKKLGHIKDYGIYSVPYGDNSVNLVLVVVFPSDEMIAPNKARYMAFLDAYGKANLDQSNTTVIDLYNKIRKIQGTYLLREVILTGK
ncbi:hypothetical protein [Erythrobacter mangrovi]|uniref:NIPSNAP family protein n=1 Tax=Erythrobacter mangrovi TaxID=2739433 RepID=A0A7D3XCT5_9SPHN|nr:hypothetical protein [Erythrobacter mangrovi]QKG72020.1 hypothetical protein HQR01_11955 [Erythrobacter mangrovi]